jgi:predicted DNA-binding protein
VPDEMIARIRAESARTGAPISEIVRRAIEAALRKKEAAQ